MTVITSAKIGDKVTIRWVRLAVLNLSPETFEEEARFALAVKLYELGRLTSGQAAQLAKISRVAFLLNCKKYGADTVQWDQTEIDSEFQDVTL